MKCSAKHTGVAAGDCGQEECLHFPQTGRKLRRRAAIIIIKPPGAFFPSRGSVNLLAKEFSHEWMGIELHGVARVVPGNEARSSKFGNHHSPFRRAQTHQWFRKPRYWRFPSEDGKHPFVYGTVKKTQHPEDGNLRSLTKPRLVGPHDFARVRSLPRVTRQVLGHFLAQPYISVISVSKKTTEQRECQTMATEFLTCRLQLLFRSLDAQR